MRAFIFPILRGDGDLIAERGRRVSRPLVGRPGWSADHWAAPTGPSLFPMEGIITKGCTKVTWSSTIMSAAGIGASDGGGSAERAAADVVVKDFGVPSPAMACGWWDAARIDGGFGVDGNKVEGERV